jgi:hypothetical protein
LGAAYKDSTNESVLREYAVVKRYFIEKLCNNNKKPTGEAAPVKVGRAQHVYHAILAKSGCGNYGASSDVDDDDEGQTYEDVAQTQTVNDVVPLRRAVGSRDGSNIL